MSMMTDDFRDAFRAHPAGVALIAAEVDGELVGLTMTSLSSVSLDPLTVSFSLSRSSGSAGKILRATGYTIHLLGDEDTDIARAFSTSDGPRFVADQGWSTLPTGEPYLPAAPVAFRARTFDVLPVGDSRLIAAEVLDVIPGRESPRLVYQERQFFSAEVARAL
ncbi:flavin reductase family protein [Dietzia sp.]|uniref:flavin reductase family protein n=1 Tax=Dietzia sp. TaxID=1871616 RepID=UPI002FDA4C68